MSRGTLRLSGILRAFEGVEAKVGWFETARYPDGTPVAMAATVNEFGTDQIPARPFMRPALEDHGIEWLTHLADGARAALAPGGPTPATVLESVAMLAAGDVATKISQVMSPELSPVTISQRRPQSTKPLVDTGQMIQSVTGVVERT